LIQRMREHVSGVRLDRIHPDLRITFSAGITACVAGEGLASAVERTEQALQAAKQGGRDRNAVV